MKNFAMIFMLLMGSLHFQSTKPPSQNYIEIQHIGAELKSSKTLFISTEKLHLPVKLQESLITASRPKGGFTEKERQTILPLFCDFAVTDKKTYSAILFYANKHQTFFPNHPQENNNISNTGYPITINGKAQDVYGKSAHDYIDGLINYLNAKNYDKNIIQKLNILAALTVKNE